MKTFLKILSTTVLAGCLSVHLHAQVENNYVIKYEILSHRVSESGWFCKGYSSRIEMSAFVGGVPKNLSLNDNTLSAMPEKFRFTGYLSIGSDAPRYYANYEKAYIKGMNPFTLAIDEFFDTGCERSIYAQSKITVDDPVNVSSDLSKTKSNSFATETEKLILRIDNFYQNGNPAELQVSVDGVNWQFIRNVRPGEIVGLSYEEIIAGKVDFETWLGKSLSFRVVKTLLNGTKTFGKVVRSIVFYPDGMKFTITSTKRTYCDNDVKLTVHLENKDDARCMTLDTNRFRWIMVRDTARLTSPFYCHMKPIDDDEFYIWPMPRLNTLPWETVFQEEEDVVWYLQLQDRMQEAQFATKRPFTIPAKPKKITVAQIEPKFKINGYTYHVPHLNSHYAMLNITDSSYASHHRLPYYVNIGDNHEIPVPELGATSFEDLTPDAQEKWKEDFEKEYAEDLKNMAARKNFANAQQGQILYERVEQIAMPKDGSFFLYIKKEDSNYRLHKATFTSGTNVETTPLVPFENVIAVEVTPDGAYCIYKKYNVAGLFVLPLTGAIPPSGTLLSNKSGATTVSALGTEPINHIYKDTLGSWAFASVYNHNMYGITIPGGHDTIITSLSKPVHVSEQGIGFYEEPLSPSNSTYRIFKVNILKQSNDKEIILPGIGGEKFPLPDLPEAKISLFYSYDDQRVRCEYIYYKGDGYSTPPYTDCSLKEYLQNLDGTFYANTNNPEEMTICESERCIRNDSELKEFIDILLKEPIIDYPFCYRKKAIYKKECTTSRAYQNKALVTVAPDGSFVIISNNNTTYYKIPGEAAIPSGSNFKISPNNTDFVFTSNGHTYKNNTTAPLIQDQKSANICFAGHGRYFLFVDPTSGHVHKKYMSEEDALADTEPLFRESQWNQFLNKHLGTKVSSKHIELNTPDSLTWILKDADGCEYDTFKVRVTAPEDPTMRYIIKKYPTSVCANDGVAIITYLGGGNAPFLHPSGTLQNQDDQITVSGLKFGNNEIQFTDSLGRQSYLFPVPVGGSAEISGVEVTHQTCATPNGKVQVSVEHLSGKKTYTLKNTVYSSSTYSKTTTENTYEFTDIPAGMYTVSVSQDECYFERTNEEVESHIFKITDIDVTPSTTLEGTGSATVTFVNRDGTAEWLTGDHLFDSHSVTQDTVVTRNGGIAPGTHAFSVLSSTGCVVSGTMTIDKPTYSGAINLNYTKDSLRIYANGLTGNALFDPYTFKIINSHGETIMEDKKPNVVIRQPDNYALYAYRAQPKDSSRLYEFTFPVDSIKAPVDIAPPVCPEGVGTITVSVQDGGFGDRNAIRVSIYGMDYVKPQKFNLEASLYNAWLRDTIVTTIGNLDIHATLLQPFSFVVPAMEPVSADVNEVAPSCAGLANGTLQLSNFTGGSGDYEYKINDNAWQDTTVVIDELGPGTYNVYLRDKKYQCAPQELRSVKFRAPDTLKVNITAVKHPKCELSNGSLSATLSGGSGYYRYDWYRDNNLIASADYDEIFEVNLGDTLPDGFYKLQIYDGKQCVASDTATLRTYHNPQVETVSITAASCAGAKDGTVELLTASGTAPVDSVRLSHLSLPYTYSNATGVFNGLDTGKYTLILRDTLGCYTTTPYPLFVDEPDPLHIAVDTILPVAGKGSRSGKIILHLYGGNAGQKIIRLKQADGVAVDSLLYINNVIPLSFTQYAGSYYIEAVDSKGCRATTGALQIEEPAHPLTLVIKEVKDARCKSQVGSIMVEGAGGWGEYRYKRERETSFTTLNTFDNLYPGRYVITVTDKLGATYSETVVVHEPKDSLMAAVTSRVLPTCGHNGAFSVQLSGGTPPYKLYENADTVFCAQPQTVEWTGKESGNYLLHLVDNNGCRFELEANLPDVALLAIEKMDVKYPVLPAAPDGEITVTVRGGTAPYTYQWTQDATTALAVNSPVLVDIPAGHYGVAVTDAEGCTVRENVLLTDPSYVSFTVLAVGHETAFKAANGYAVLLADAPLSDYTLITPANTKITYAGSDVTDVFRVQNDTVFLHGLSGGKWMIAGVNSTGHHVVAEFSINVYNEFTIDNISISPVRKKGLADGQARIEVRGGGGGNRYSWATSSGTPVPSVDNEYSSILRDAPAGSYTVTIEDGYGNLLREDIVIEEPEQALTLKVADYQNQSCKTAQDAYVVLSAVGGWGDYQFRHQTEPYFSNSATYRNLEVAGHYFYVTDRQGVTDSLLVDITEPEHVHTSVALIDPVKCKDALDGNVLFTVTGGTAPYSLSALNSGIWQEGTIAKNLQAGSHTFVFKDKNNCVGQDTLAVYVTEPDSLLFQNVKVTHTTCDENNGKIAVSMKGGASPYQYQWTDSGNTLVGNDAEISGLLQNRTYRLKVTDRNGCMQHLEQLIYPSALPDIAGLQATPVLCHGDTTGTATVLAVVPAEPYAPYSLLWSNGDQGTFSNRFYEGTHHVTVTDANGCVATRYFDITQPDSLYLFDTEVRNPHCHGYSDGRILTGTLGGVQAYTYQWSHGATAPDVDNLAEGTYSVVVTDANGCAYQKSFTLSAPDAQTVDLGEDVVICPGNTHLLDGQDYAAYRWYTAAGDISNERYLYVREAGRYFLEATDARGCPAFGEVRITIGNNALKADFLLASEAALGDTIMVFELSNMALDSLRWDYDHTAFERVFWNNDYDYSYILSLLSVQPGRHDIDLYAYSGGCYSRATKSIDIGTERAPTTMHAMNNAVPLITSVTVYPNPNNAVFAVEIKLRETADVRLVLFSVVPGASINDRTERGSDYYHISYNLPQLATGMYVMMVMAGDERQLVKLIIAR